MKGEEKKSIKINLECYMTIHNKTVENKLIDFKCKGRHEKKNFSKNKVEQTYSKKRRHRGLI